VTCAGRYTSHWRLYDVDSKSLFGPTVWCTVIVDQSLTCVTAAAAAANDPLSASVAVPGCGGVDVGLSTEDLFAFVKTLEMTAAKKTSARPGPLAVPTNTPLGQCQLRR